MAELRPLLEPLTSRDTAPHAQSTLALHHGADPISCFQQGSDTFLLPPLIPPKEKQPQKPSLSLHPPPLPFTTTPGQGSPSQPPQPNTYSPWDTPWVPRDTRTCPFPLP